MSLVGADVGSLDALARRLRADRDRLADIAARTAWALAAARDVTDELTLLIAPPAVDRALREHAERLGEIARSVQDTATRLAAADDPRWRRTTGAVLWLDEAVTVRLHELPGMGGLPGADLRAAIADLAGPVCELDSRGHDVLGRAGRRVQHVAHARAARVADTASGLWGGGSPAWVGRATDVLRSPAVRSAGGLVGRSVAGLGIVADVATAVERSADGDAWGAARSVAAAGGGLTVMLAGATIVGVAGAVVVGGVLLYEHREALGRAGGAVLRGVGRGARRAGDAAGDLVDGARQLLGARSP